MKAQKQAENYKSLLREKGLKATPARVALLSLLARAKTPLTVEEIIKGVSGDGFDQATVYRSLGALREEGLVRLVDFQHGHAHYELKPEKDHHHLVCTVCDRVEDFHMCLSEQIIQAALKESSYFKKVDEHSLELFGVCTSCARKVNKKT